MYGLEWVWGEWEGEGLCSGANLRLDSSYGHTAGPLEAV